MVDENEEQHNIQYTASDDDESPYAVAGKPEKDGKTKKKKKKKSSKKSPKHDSDDEIEDAAPLSSNTITSSEPTNVTKSKKKKSTKKKSKAKDNGIGDGDRADALEHDDHPEPQHKPVENGDDNEKDMNEEDDKQIRDSMSNLSESIALTTSDAKSEKTKTKKKKSKTKLQRTSSLESEDTDMTKPDSTSNLTEASTSSSTKKKKKKKKTKEKEKTKESNYNTNDDEMETDGENEADIDTDNASTASAKKKTSRKPKSKNKGKSPKGTGGSSEHSVLDLPVNRSAQSTAPSVTSAYFSRDDDDDDSTAAKGEDEEAEAFLASANDSVLDNWSVASSTNNRKHSLSKEHKSPRIKKKKSNQFANGAIKLKITTDGTAKVSKPMKLPDLEGSESEDVDHNPSGTRSFSPTRKLSCKVQDKDETRRSKSADNLADMVASMSSPDSKRGGSRSGVARRGKSEERSLGPKLGSKSRRVSEDGLRVLQRALAGSKTDEKEAASDSVGDKKGRPVPAQSGVRRPPAKRRTKSADGLAEMQRTNLDQKKHMKKGRTSSLAKDQTEEENEEDTDNDSSSHSSKLVSPVTAKRGVEWSPLKRRTKSADGLAEMQHSTKNHRIKSRLDRNSFFEDDIEEEEEDSEEDGEDHSSSTHSSRKRVSPVTAHFGLGRLPSKRRSKSADGLAEMQHSTKNHRIKSRQGRNSILEVDMEEEDSEKDSDSNSSSTHSSRIRVSPVTSKLGLERLPSKRRSKSADGLVEMQRADMKRRKNSRNNRYNSSLSESIKEESEGGSEEDTEEEIKNNNYGGGKPKKTPPKRFSTRRSKGRSVSADDLLELQRLANSEHSNTSSGSKGSESKSSHHRRSPRAEPQRLAARNGRRRSISADGLMEMRETTSRNARPRAPPARRSVNRNSSAPVQPRPSPGNRAPPRRSRTFVSPGTTVRKPPRRSRDLSADDHVEMLQSVESFDGDSVRRKPRRRSNSDPGKFLEESFNDESVKVSNRRQQRREQSSMNGSKSLSPSRLDSSDSSLNIESLHAEKPRSILRSASTRSNRSNLSSRSVISANSSNHNSVNFSTHSVTYASDLESDDALSSEYIEEAIYFGDEDEENNNRSRRSGRSFSNRNRQMSRQMSRNRSSRKGLRKTQSTASSMFQSFRSNRSQMSIDSSGSKEIFQDDPKWKAALRYVRLLPPYVDETSAERKIRIFTWISITLDFVAALVSLIQYSGSATCCGDPIFDVFLKINWDALFRSVVILYMVLIFAEFVPVVRNGIPFNLVNPLVGFIITFGMFFDDSVPEAVVMWTMEVLAIFFEFLVYRVNARMYYETSFELKQVETELKEVKKHFRALRDQSKHSSMSDSIHSRTNDVESGRSRAPVYYSDIDDDNSLSGRSFGEEFEDEKSLSGRSLSSIIKPKPPSSKSSVASGRSTRHSRRDSDIDSGSTHSHMSIDDLARAHLKWEVKQNKLLRKRRMLRESKKNEEIELNYHFIGTMLNVGIATMAMIFIIAISSTGGLCFLDGKAKVFNFDQINKCNLACPTGVGSECEEYCTEDTQQCYFHYYG